MKEIILYSTAFCGWCEDAKEYLTAQGLPFKEVNVARDPAARAEVFRISGQEYVPTIVVDGKVLANFDVEQLKSFLANLGEK